MQKQIQSILIKKIYYLYKILWGIQAMDLKNLKIEKKILYIEASQLLLLNLKKH